VVGIASPKFFWGVDLRAGIRKMGKVFIAFDLMVSQTRLAIYVRYERLG
jgi:hypothetical protein